VRIRIALLTALAVTMISTAVLTVIASSPAGSARTTERHQAHNLPVDTQSTFFNIPVVVHTASGATWVDGDGPPVLLAAPVVVAPPPPPVITDANSTATADWMCIRIHESGDRYNDPAAPSGAYGILLSTWESFGYSGWPYQAAPAVQDHLALELYHMYGFHPWSSRYACGL